MYLIYRLLMLGGCQHLVNSNGLHKQLSALHHHAFVLVISSVCQESTFVKKHQSFGAVGARDFNMHTPTAVMVSKTLFQPE